jgi:hypothetical protein
MWQKRPYARPAFTILGSDPTTAEQSALAHMLNNKLGVILGECAVLAQSTNDPKYLMRLQTIQSTVHSMADQITRYQSRIAGAMTAGAGGKETNLGWKCARPIGK